MRIIHLSLNTFQHASRALRAISAATEAFPDVDILVLAFLEQGIPQKEQLSTRAVVRRLRIGSRNLPKFLLAQIVKYIEWSVRALTAAIRFKPNIVQCHSLPALPVGVLIKLMTGARILYDAHELETERNGIVGIRQDLSKIVERLLIGFADETVVVSPSIARWYEKAYPKSRFAVVRNAPPLKRQAARPFDLRKLVEAQDQDIVVLYLGGLVPGRGIPFILAAFRELPPHYKVVFVGRGVSEAIISEAARDTPNIKLLKAVRPDEVVDTARGADIGISLLDSNSLSYRYALPNKLFEYTLAGLPSIVNEDFPEMARFVAEEASGWTVLLGSNALISLISKISKEAVREKKLAISQRGCLPSWEQEVPKLLEIYRRLAIKS